MKLNKYYFITGIVLVVAAGFWIRRELRLISHADPDYNTVYAPGYDDEKFDDRLIGLTEQEAIAVLGDPLYRKQRYFLNVLLYSENKTSVFAFRDDDCIVYRQGHKKELKTRRFYFDSTGRLFDIKLNGYTENDSALIGSSIPQVISRFGQPDDEVLRLPGTEELYFSELTKGTQSGKTETYHIRKLVLNKGKTVTAVIRGLGGMNASITCKQ